MPPYMVMSVSQGSGLSQYQLANESLISVTLPWHQVNYGGCYHSTLAMKVLLLHMFVTNTKELLVAGLDKRLGTELGGGNTRRE